jgi:hypothetical protein
LVLVPGQVRSRNGPGLREQLLELGVTAERALGGLVLGGPSVPSAVVVCTRCGYLSVFWACSRIRRNVRRSRNDGSLLEDHDRRAGNRNRAADHYKIPIIRREVQNLPHNTTRFILISVKKNEPCPGMKCSVLIDPQVDRVGLLHDLLEVLLSLFR